MPPTPIIAMSLGKPERNIFITAVARAAKGLPDNPPSSAAWRKPLTDGGRAFVVLQAITPSMPHLVAVSATV